MSSIGVFYVLLKCLFKRFFQVSNHYFLELGNEKYTATGLSIYHMPHIKVNYFSFMIFFFFPQIFIWNLLYSHKSPAVPSSSTGWGNPFLDNISVLKLIIHNLRFRQMFALHVYFLSWIPPANWLAPHQSSYWPKSLPLSLCLRLRSS